MVNHHIIFRIKQESTHAHNIIIKKVKVCVFLDLLYNSDHITFQMGVFFCQITLVLTTPFI